MTFGNINSSNHRDCRTLKMNNNSWKKGLLYGDTFDIHNGNQ